MRLGNTITGTPACDDRTGLWAETLSDWAPETLFDAHVHLSPPSAMEPYSEERLREALCTFGGMEWEEYLDCCNQLFPGKRFAGHIVFPFPMREINLPAANACIRQLMRQQPNVQGFILAHPTDGNATRIEFERGLADGVRFTGVKPYFDLLGKSNFVSTMPEFIPDSLLEFMNAESLILMLHTSGYGVGIEENQQYLRNLLSRYPNVKVLLAHMGRFCALTDFDRFADTDLLDFPNLYLEMSWAPNKEIYLRTMQSPAFPDRLLFGTDMPYGLLRGIEAWSEETGHIFATSDDTIPWGCHDIPDWLWIRKEELTHNTYHVIHGFKQALDATVSDATRQEEIKRKVFHDNAAALF